MLDEEYEESMQSNEPFSIDRNMETGGDFEELDSKFNENEDLKL